MLHKCKNIFKTQFLKENAMIGRSGLTRQAQCIIKYSSIAEEGTSPRAHFIKKYTIASSRRSTYIQF